MYNIMGLGGMGDIDGMGDMDGMGADILGMYNIMGDMEGAEMEGLDDSSGWGGMYGDAILGDAILGGMGGYGTINGMGADILGRRRHRMWGMGAAAPAALVQQAALQRKLRQGTVLQQYNPMKGRQLILGFASTGTVAAGATVDIIQRPQLVFRPERVVIPAAIGANFNVADIRIGKNSQFLSAGAIPGAVFAEGAFGVRLKMDTAQIAMDIDLRVTNISAGALNFFAAMIGDSVE